MPSVGFLRLVLGGRDEKTEPHDVNFDELLEDAIIQALDFVRATRADMAFLDDAYRFAARVGAVEVVVNRAQVLDRCLAVSCRERSHDPHPHPFYGGQQATLPCDDIFVLKVAGAAVGVLWMRDWDSDILYKSSETYGELLLYWLRPQCRGQGYWPQVDSFAKRWAAEQRRGALVGRCRKPSRRMAELFTRSGYALAVEKPSGATLHIWRLIL